MSTLKGGPNTIKDNSLIMYLDVANTKCYTGTGTLWNDLTNNGNNGTLMAPITFASNPSRFETNANTTLDFNQILCNNTLTFADTSEYSFDFFIKLRTGWLTGGTFNNITGTGLASSPFLSLRPTGSATSWNIWWRQTGGVYVIGSTLSVDITNIWINLSFVITANRVVTVYYNGVFLQTFTLATSAFQVNRIASAYNASDTNYYSLQGAIATARYYNRALTSTEVTQNYNALKGRFNL